MERFSFVFLVAGLGFFALAFAVSAWIPMLPVKDLEVRTLEQISAQVPMDVLDLKEEYPEAFEKAFPGMSIEQAFTEALRTGHKIYRGEACWHCHSQQVRPWGGDEARYGQRSFPEEYNHELAMPPLWGTRRIGPDLIRRGGKQSNDWHVAHFYNPPDVSPRSVMPAYPWFYEEDGVTPNKKGLSIIAYVQWLGSWVDTIPESLGTLSVIEGSFEAPVMALPQAPAEEGEGEGEGDDFFGEESDDADDFFGQEENN